MTSMFHNLIDKYCDQVYNGNFIMIRKINVDTHILILQCFEYFMKMIRWKLIIYVNVNYVILDHCALIYMHSYIISLDYWCLIECVGNLNHGNELGKQGSSICEHSKAKVNLWKIQNLVVLCLFHNVIVHVYYKFKDQVGLVTCHRDV